MSIGVLCYDYCRHVRDEYYRYVCELLLGFQDLVLTTARPIFELLIQKQYTFESDQHASGSCRPDVVLVPYSFFSGVGFAVKPSPTP